MTIQELKKAFEEAKREMYEAKSAYYKATDGYTYSLHTVLAKDILDPTPLDWVFGNINNASALEDWWWHDRSTESSYVLFTNNINFNFDTVEGISPIIEKEVGEYRPVTAVVYKSAEEIKKIKEVLGEMLNFDSLLTNEDYCLSKLLTLL